MSILGNIAKIMGIAPGSKVTVNGQSFHGQNVTIVNGVVTVDGVQRATMANTQINVSIHGDVTTIENGSGNIIVTGSAGDLKTGSGDITVHGDAQSATTGSGDIFVQGDIKGSANTGSGDIIL